LDEPFRRATGEGGEASASLWQLGQYSATAGMAAIEKPEKATKPHDLR
jgi:hypothetical protein